MKKNLQELVDLKKSAGDPILLELGCGDRKRHHQAIGIDIIDYGGVDVVGDVEEVLRQLPDGIVDGAFSYHFIEHIENVESLLDELGRVMKPGAIVEFVAPHFSNPYFYSDPTHRTFFGLYTMCYLSRSSLFSRTVPSYRKEFYFDLLAVDLGFKSHKAFIVRYGLKYMMGKLFNCCRYMKEFYEENLCYIFPCYEIKYRLSKRIDNC
jgi:ubiquinone/menaquinone biosynthesis C-methylase UbiE